MYNLDNKLKQNINLILAYQKALNEMNLSQKIVLTLKKERTKYCYISLNHFLALY
jgi:hypothetical protein